MPLSARHVAELRVRRALTLVRARRPPRRKQAPPARWPRAARLTYFAELKALLADLRAGLDRLLMPQLPRLLALVEANKPRLDSADDLKRELDGINDLTDDLLTTERVRRMADKVAQQVSDFNKGEVNRQFRSVLGIDLLHGEPYLQQQLGMFADDNARLITTLAQEHLDQVAGIVMRAARSGQRVEDLRDELQARFSITESKAGLLARDQVGKLNGELTQLRHQSVGVSEYEWSTSRDERVRSRHAELEGTTHAWDDPPVVDERTGRRAHPGQDIQCRCTAIPKVDDLLDALGADPEVQPEPKQPAPPPPVEQPAPAPARGVPFVLPDIEPLVRSPELPAVPSKPLTREQADRVVSRLPKVDLDTLVNRPSDKAVQLGRSIQLDMSEREKEALHYWGEEGYKRIGRVEAGKINPDRDSPEKVAEARSHIDHLYRAIGEAELKAEERGDEPIQLYRGISFNSADTYSRFVVENEVDFDRLSSWSSDPKIAEEFTVLGEHKVIFSLRTTGGLPIASYAPAQGEAESLLGKRRMRVVSRHAVLGSNGDVSHLLIELEEM